MSRQPLQRSALSRRHCTAFLPTAVVKRFGVLGPLTAEPRSPESPGSSLLFFLANLVSSILGGNLKTCVFCLLFWQFCTFIQCVLILSIPQQNLHILSFLKIKNIPFFFAAEPVCASGMCRAAVDRVVCPLVVGSTSLELLL